MTSIEPGGPRRKADITREKLIDAAHVVFRRDGYQNARIADISTEAGKAVGVFYRYFKDKQEIFSACIDQFYEDLVESGPSAEEFEKNTLEAIHASTATYWQKYADHYGAIAGLFEAGMTDPALALVWRRIRENGIKRFAFRIRKQQQLGKCSDLDPVIAASALFSMLEFTCYNWNSQRLDFPDRTIGRQTAIDNLFALIRNALELQPSNPESVSPDRPAKQRAKRPTRSHR